jgi:hypothetical protein
VADPRWLLLAFQLPARLSSARVRVWRRLQQLGAVPTRNSVYVLPNTEQCAEDFEWLRREIEALGGAATVFTADAVSEGGTEDIVGAFQQSRADEYRALQKDIARISKAAGAGRAGQAGRAGRAGRAVEPKQVRAVRALRDRFDTLARIDFFGAAERGAAAFALADLERRMAGQTGQARQAGRAGGKKVADYQRKRWVTRKRPGVDRMASAWLIRTFIDPRATFAFVDKPAVSDVAFDMYGGGFGHRGGLCTFEVLCADFGIASPAVSHIAHIVHDLDLKEHVYAMPEAPVVERMVEGLRALHAQDGPLLEQGIAMFDALARSFEVKPKVK